MPTTKTFRAKTVLEIEIRADSAEEVAAKLDDMSASDIAEDIQSGVMKGEIKRGGVEEIKPAGSEPVLREMIFRADSLPHDPVLGFAPAEPRRDANDESLPADWAAAYGAAQSVENTLDWAEFESEAEMKDAGYRLVLAAIDDEGSVAFNTGTTRHHLTAEDIYGRFGMEVPGREADTSEPDGMEP